MKGDFSRNSYDPSKRYSSVRMQQGRVQLDADWNEQMDILDYRNSLTIQDALGLAAAPSTEPHSYEITTASDSTNFGITAGRFYVNGYLVENLNDITYTTQVDFPGAIVPDYSITDPNQNYYLAYLEVWQQGFNSVEDSTIAEIALGGADTSTRIRNLGQVKLFPVYNDGSLPTPITYASAFNVDHNNSAAAIINQQNWAGLTTRLPIPSGSSSTTTISQLTPSLEGPNLQNQLYRIQIREDAASATVVNAPPPTATSVTLNISNNASHTFQVNEYLHLTTPIRRLMNNTVDTVKITGISTDPTTQHSLLNTTTLSGEHLSSDIIAGGSVDIVASNTSNTIPFKPIATFTWSRDNAYVTAQITKVNNTSTPAQVVINFVQQDNQIGFSAGDWIELNTVDRQLNGIPGDFVQITSITPAISGSTLTLSSSFGSDIIANTSFARRWDSPEIAITTDGKIPIENGLNISFSSLNTSQDISFKKGDYWLIPTRLATNSYEWPPGGANQSFTQPPLGIHRYFTPLALLQRLSDGWNLVDGSCRQVATSTNLLNVIGTEGNAPAQSIYVDNNGNVSINKGQAGLNVAGPTNLAGEITVSSGTLKVDNVTAAHANTPLSIGNANTSTINIGTTGTTNTIGIGNSTSNTTVSGNLLATSIQSSASATPLTIGTSGVNAIHIGSVGSTTTLNGTVNVATLNSTSAATPLTIGTTATNTVNIGTSGSTTTIGIGNSSTSTTVSGTLRAATISSAGNAILIGGPGITTTISDTLVAPTINSSSSTTPLAIGVNANNINLGIPGGATTTTINGSLVASKLNSPNGNTSLAIGNVNTNTIDVGSSATTTIVNGALKTTAITSISSGMDLTIGNFSTREVNIATGGEAAYVRIGAGSTPTFINGELNANTMNVNSILRTPAISPPPSGTSIAIGNAFTSTSINGDLYVNTINSSGGAPLAIGTGGSTTAIGIGSVSCPTTINGTLKANVITPTSPGGSIAIGDGAGLAIINGDLYANTINSSNGAPLSIAPYNSTVNIGTAGTTTTIGVGNSSSTTTVNGTLKAANISANGNSINIGGPGITTTISGPLSAPSLNFGHESLKIIRGSVEYTGMTGIHPNFSITGSGYYAYGAFTYDGFDNVIYYPGFTMIYFTTAFTTTPTVTAVQHYSSAGYNNFLGFGGSSADNLVLVAVDASSFMVLTGDDARNKVYRSFDFIAIGN